MLTNTICLGDNKKRDTKTCTINRNDISQRQNITNAIANCIYGKEFEVKIIQELQTQRVSLAILDHFEKEFSFI